MSNLIREILAEKQFKVKPYADPSLILPRCEGASCRMDSPCVDVILTDNQMPTLTGLEFLESLKEIGCKLPDHHKAIISGNWSRVQLDQADRLSCMVFHKPTPTDDVLA